VDLTPAENEILARCSSPMRNNIRKATRKGVILNIKSELNEKEWELFKKMQEDTNKRAGKNIFPPEEYFRNLFKAFPSIFYSDIEENKAYSGILAASHNNEFCGMHIVIFFGNTATFLFGASFTNKLSLKISPFLHWNTILEAKRLEYRFYDIGGIDEKLWKTLTYFKEQFGGKKVEYIGNVDFVIIPIFYFIYETLRKIKRLV
jgi:lipid II:glycine glycyltransferase (peptidoglycan interpeptide bridge formation enzyme)